MIARRIIDEFRCADGWIGIVRNGRFEWLLNRKCNPKNDISRTVPSKRINATYLRQFGSMRQILDLSTTPECCNASTCGFLMRKGRCTRRFRNLPHTSVERFQKCGENPRSADQTPILSFRDLRFCCKKTGCARRFPIFPALPKNAVKKPSVWKRKTRQTYS